MKSFIFILLALASLTVKADDRAVTFTRLSKVDTTFECKVTSTGHCYYLITTSTCKEEILPTGEKYRTCQISPHLNFELAMGEKKLVSNLPSDFQHCMKPDAMPDVATCVANPLSH
jgi:hypothetical protein